MSNMIIRGGTVFDAVSKTFSRRDIGIRAGRICPADEVADSSSKEIDASSCYVVPGFVDHHAHLFYGGSELGAHEEMACLPFGVTTAADAGTAGAANFPAFAQRIAGSMVRIKAQINIAVGGITSFRYAENVDPALYDRGLIKAVIDRYGKDITGIKLRLGKDKGIGSSLRALHETLKIADDFGLPVIIHTTEPVFSLEDMVRELRPGDTFAHVHQGMGETILDEKGHVRRLFREAQSRGVLFDAAKGVRNCSFRVASQAIQDGFLPDIISSDITSRSIYKNTVFSLPFVLSAYMHLGLSLEDVLLASTLTPARALGLENEIGSLDTGKCADITIMRVLPGHFTCTDGLGESIAMNRCIIPQITLRAGEIVFRTLNA